MNKDIKLFRILKSLSRKEINQLQSAVESPLYPLALPSQKLYHILRPHYRKLDSTSEGKKNIFAELFPGESYDDAKLRRVFSNLTQVVKKFLAYNQLQNDTWQREKTLAEAYEELGLSTVSQQIRENLYERVDQEPLKNENYWKKKMILSGVQQSALLSNRKEASTKLAKETSSAADHYFAYATVRHALLIKSKAYVFDTPYNLSYLEAVKKAYKNGLLRDDSLFRLYVLALQLIEEPRKDVFFAYQSLYFNQGNVGYGEDDLFLFYIGLNYAVRQINGGDIDFQKLPLEWYKFGLNRNILLVNGLMEHVDFSNIVFFGCQNNEIDWTLTFIKDYIKLLPLEIQEEEFLYSKASIFFQENKFYEVIDNISEYPFSSAYALKSKVLILKSHFEIYLKDSTYTLTLISSILAFESYLYRDKKRTKANKLPYINFCKILKKILILRIKKISKTVISKQIRKQVAVKKVIVSKNWLLEKVII